MTKNPYMKFSMKWFTEQEEINKSIDAPFKEGQIVYRTWGYNQTNVDFAVIEKVTAKSVLLRSIKQWILPQTVQGMTGHVVPIKDVVTDYTLRKAIKFSDITNEYYLPGGSSWSGNWHLYTEGDKGIWSSWYA